MLLQAGLQVSGVICVEGCEVHEQYILSLQCTLLQRKNYSVSLACEVML